MNTKDFCSAWAMLYLLIIFAGYLVGVSLGHTQVDRPGREAANGKPVFRTSSPEAPISDIAPIVERLKTLTVEEMNLEITRFRQADRQFSLVSFFGGNRSRQMEAEQIARRQSYGKYDNHTQLEASFRDETDVNAKRDIYNRLCYGRLFSLLYLYETSRKAGLLVQPISANNETIKSSVNQQVEVSK